MGVVIIVEQVRYRDMDSLAGALVTSKVKGFTKDLGDAVGLNEDNDNRNNEVNSTSLVGQGCDHLI